MGKSKTAKIFSTGCPYDNQYQTSAVRLLFVCSVGMLRSPTAQMVASGMGYNARACGSDVDLALIPLSCNLIDWAHHIIFMNTTNLNEALECFKPIDDYADIINRKQMVWHITDDYDWGDNVLWAICHDNLLKLNK